MGQHFKLQVQISDFAFSSMAYMCRYGVKRIVIGKFLQPMEVESPSNVKVSFFFLNSSSDQRIFSMFETHDDLNVNKAEVCIRT